MLFILGEGRIKSGSRIYCSTTCTAFFFWILNWILYLPREEALYAYLAVKGLRTATVRAQWRLPGVIHMNCHNFAAHYEFRGHLKLTRYFDFCLNSRKIQFLLLMRLVSGVTGVKRTVKLPLISGLVIFLWFMFLVIFLFKFVLWFW